MVFGYGLIGQFENDDVQRGMYDASPHCVMICMCGLV
jgi:hypothetical protein